MDKIKNQRLKVCFINVYQGVVDRGGETFVKELADDLSRVHVVDVISGKGRLPKRWPVWWRVFLDPQGILIGWFTLRNLGKIWREKYDVVIPLNGGWQAVLVRLITWVYGGRMVVSGQSGAGWDDRVNLWCFPDVFVALSKKAMFWGRGVNRFVKMMLIPNGVNLDRFSDMGDRFKVELERPVVLCVGALSKEKRIDLVIRAVAGLKKGSLLVVGRGELKEEMVDLGSRLLGRRFKLVGLPFEKMPEVYRAADVFTLPSVTGQSFEIVLVEAMASGLPVVANDDSIRREIVGEAGILVDPTDEEVLAKALKYALEKDWGDEPRKQAEKFSWERIAKEYEQLFYELNR